MTRIAAFIPVEKLTQLITAEASIVSVNHWCVAFPRLEDMPGAIALSDFSESDQLLLRPGVVCIFSLFYEDTPTGERRRVQVIRVKP